MCRKLNKRSLHYLSSGVGTLFKDVALNYVIFITSESDKILRMIMIIIESE